jgi:hypothetical protein
MQTADPTKAAIATVRHTVLPRKDVFDIIPLYFLARPMDFPRERSPDWGCPIPLAMSLVSIEFYAHGPVMIKAIAALRLASPAS